MKKELTFNIPFSGFCGTTFINCFTSAFLFMEAYAYKREERKPCGTATCDECGYCREDGAVFFLFDTMSGRSALRCRFDGAPTEPQKWILGGDGFYDGETDETIDFLFGFAGYEFRKCADADAFKKEIVASIDTGRPVIVKVKTGENRYRVITGYDGDALICPDFTQAQKKPERAPVYDELDALWLFGAKIPSRYSVTDGLERIVKVMESNDAEKLWDGYANQMDFFGYRGLGFNTNDNNERAARLKRVADTMWHTFNCHNFAEVFRKFGNGDCAIYDTISDMKRLRDPAFKDLCNTIGGPCHGYTHDLAWSLIGLEECADWTKHSAQYFGEMTQLIIMQIAKNDEKALETVKQILAMIR